MQVKIQDEYRNDTFTEELERVVKDTVNLDTSHGVAEAAADVADATALILGRLLSVLAEKNVLSVSDLNTILSSYRFKIVEVIR